MDNREFLRVISNSFRVFLETGSRSNEKLKILHGAIAMDIQKRLGGAYGIYSLGIGNNKEADIKGRYIDKKVDITVRYKDKVVAGIGVKFVMQNYSQNSNNYFENMLGETANIRCSNVPYFQMFIIPEKLPYYKQNGRFDKWEYFTAHNVQKYLQLSEDVVETFVHTPTKTLLYVIRLPELDETPVDRDDYIRRYLLMRDIPVALSENCYGDFGNAVVHNDYEAFASKICYYIQSI